MTPERVHLMLGRDPARTALLFDFDGSLAPIVDDPSRAEPAPGAAELLELLAPRFGRVGVISGRPLDYLEARLPETVALSALYGLEGRIDGERRQHPEAEAWRRAVSEMATAAGVPDGVRIETKGPSLTVHYRGRDDLADAARDWAQRTAEASGFRVRPAKASFEVHPPVDVSKRTAVLDLVGSCSTVSFVGDDIGDLPAFQALDELAARGLDVAKIAAGGAELPPEVQEIADLTVAGPGEVVSLFATLVT